MIRFITYSDGKRILVTTPELEAQCISNWFTDAGEDIMDYDREEFTYASAVCIESRLRLSD